MPLGLLGKKLGQTRVYDTRGTAHSVTIVLAGPNRVLQCKTNESDGYQAVQLGFDDQKEHRITKPLNGHFKKNKSTAVKRVREFRFTFFVWQPQPGCCKLVGQAGRILDQ